MGRLEGEAGHGRCAWQHTAVPALTGLFKTRQPDNNSLAANDILQSARVATSEPLIVPVPSNGALFWRDWPGPMCMVAPREPALIELFKIRQPDNNSLAANDMLQRTRVATSEPLIVPVSSNGALFWRGWSRLIRVVAPRGARLPPLGLKLAGQTKPTLRPTSSTKAHGLQFCITHTLQSYSFMRDCRDRKFGPQMSPMEMLCPYISMLATPAISWRPRSSLARPRVVPDTPGRALHAGGVSLTRLGRPEKSTFWWPRRVVRAATRLVRQASFQCRRPCAIFGPPVASECFHMWLYA